MPVKSLTGTTAVPEGCPLGVVMDGGVLKLFPRGATFIIVNDPNDKATWTPIVLLDASLKHLKFRCACGQKDCTRMMDYTLVATGEHKYKKGITR